jgi:chromosomal replication initiation ATPase DnaA
MLSNEEGDAKIKYKEFVESAIGRELKAANGIEDILHAVCEHYRVSKEEVLKDKKSQTKKITIYLSFSANSLK